MAHFANINSDNIVVNVLVVPNEQAHRGHEFLANDLNLGGNWIQTSYNTRRGIHFDATTNMPSLTGTPLRKNFAGKGFTYDAQRDAFIPPKPYESWVLNEESCIWEAPVAFPENGIPYPDFMTSLPSKGVGYVLPTTGLVYKWDESIVNWKPVAQKTESGFSNIA